MRSVNSKRKRDRMIVLSSCEWNRVQNSLTRKETELQRAETLAKEKEERLQLSKQMASSWDNTLVNLRKRRFAMREEKIENAIKARHEKYLFFKAEEERRKDVIRARAKEIFFEMRDSTKTLRSAEKLAETLREREEQKEFNKKVEEMRKSEELEDARKMWADVELWQREQNEALVEHGAVKVQRKKEILDDLEQCAKRKVELQKATKEEEKRYLDEMKKELEQIAEFEKEEEARFKVEYWRDVLKNRQSAEHKRLAAIEEDREEDLAIEIVNLGKIKLAQLRKEKEQEAFEESLKSRERVAAIVATHAKDRRELEDAILRKASIEKERIYEKEERRKQKHADRLRQERINTHRLYLAEEERKKAAEHELMKWAVLQRLKAEMTTSTVHQKCNDIRHRRFLECRRVNRELIEEHNAKLAKEKQADLDAVKRAAALWALHDKEFLDLAIEVRNECVAAGRPAYPLDVAIADFKKKTGLLKECRGVGYVDAVPTVPGYKEMADKLKEMEAAKAKQQQKSSTPCESKPKKTTEAIAK